MPFTASHPAAILPFLRTPLPASALVAGSIAPDLPYYVPVDVPLPKPESRSRASVSSVGSFSVVGTAASLRPEAKAARRKTVMAVVGLGVVAIAGAVTALTLTRAPQAKEASPVPPQSTSPRSACTGRTRRSWRTCASSCAAGKRRACSAPTFRSSGSST